MLLAFPARRKWATALMALALAGFYALSTPLAGAALFASLDRYPPLPVSGPLPEAECVVILGAGRRWGAAEYGADTVSDLGLERLRYGVWLAERTGRPILVTGSSSEEMAAAVEASFHAEVAWKTGGETTQGNAARTAEALLPKGLRRVYLVTHYWHMPRSAAAFRAAGFDPVPAPLGFGGSSEGTGGILMLLPRSGTLGGVNQGLHEWLGRLWYRLRYGV